MTTEFILETYFYISSIFLFVTVFLAIDGDTPDEIENVYDWLFYGLFWIFIVIKYFVKFLHKLFKT